MGYGCFNERRGGMNNIKRQSSRWGNPKIKICLPFQKSCLGPRASIKEAEGDVTGCGRIFFMKMGICMCSTKTGGEVVTTSITIDQCNEGSGPPGIAKIPVGIRGLDEVLNGGVPKGAMTLICGGPGTGKTMLGMEFLVRGAMAGHPGIMVTFEETEVALKDYAAGLGWDLAEFESKGLLTVVSARIHPEALHSGDFDLRGVIGILQQKAASMKAERVVVDAPDAFLRLLGDSSKEQAELHLMQERLREAGMTALMTVKSGTGQALSSNYDFLDYMADCVIHLDQRVQEQVSTRRLRVTKYRGSTYGRNEYPYSITNQGTWIIPVTQASLRHAGLGESLSSGVDQLDEILGGGYRRNACTLLTGNSGTGKTTFACAFALSMVSLGERVLYLDFEESWDALVSCMLSTGLDMRPAKDSGKLKFVSKMPESQGIEEHLIQAFRAFEDFEPQHLIIDAISACRRMGSEQAAFDYLIRIIDHCKQRSITTLLTNLTSVMAPGREITGIDLSSVIDTVIVLRNVEKQGRYVRDLGVLKSRGRAHSNHIHEFRITDNGFEIERTGAVHVE